MIVQDGWSYIFQVSPEDFTQWLSGLGFIGLYGDCFERNVYFRTVGCSRNEWTMYVPKLRMCVMTEVMERQHTCLCQAGDH